MDIVSIDKTNENFRIIYDPKGRFVVHRIGNEEASYKLLKVKRMEHGKGGVPYIVGHDGRTIRYPDPSIKVRYLVKILILTSPICLARIFLMYIDILVLVLLSVAEVTKDCLYLLHLNLFRIKQLKLFFFLNWASHT